MVIETAKNHHIIEWLSTYVSKNCKKGKEVVWYFSGYNKNKGIITYLDIKTYCNILERIKIENNVLHTEIL